MGAAPVEACRPAGSEDVPRLAELAEAAVTELAAGRGGLVWASTGASPRCSATSPTAATSALRPTLLTIAPPTPRTATRASSAPAPGRGGSSTALK